MALEDRHLEIAMGKMLRVGVTAAAATVLSGAILAMSRSGAPAPEYRHFHAESGMGSSIGGILSGAVHLDGRSLIELGILLLVATPVCRVIFGVVGFALLKDRLYAAISAVVLAILLVSFVMGS